MPSAPPAAEAIARHYDSLDYFYRDLWGEHVHHGLWLTGRESPRAAVEQMSRRVLARLDLPPGARLADVGCGYGGTARLAAEIHGAHVTGFTLSAAQKRHADQIPVPRGSVEIRVQDWAAAEFADGAFDALLSLESLEHMADKAGFARQARRAVRPGGRVVICTWLAADRVSRWSQRHLLDAICREARQAPLVTAAALRGVLHAAGFADVHAEDLNPQVAKTWSVILRRLVLRLFTRRRYRQFLFDGGGGDRVFALTICRLWLAYRTGCFRYGLFVCR